LGSKTEGRLVEMVNIYKLKFGTEREGREVYLRRVRSTNADIIPSLAQKSTTIIINEQPGW
jgi:hypothetical protein